MKNSIYLFTLLSALAVHSGSGYTITPKATYQGATFFDQFDFFTDVDPTDGYVNYVNRTVANNTGLISVNSDGSVYIGTDMKNVASGRGRNSIRLQSKSIFNAGTLVIADIAHMPAGCGTWPAFWMFGNGWPDTGEIDIIENVNNDVVNYITLHTNSGCTMNSNITNTMTGSWDIDDDGSIENNCDINGNGHDGDGGCGVMGAPGSFGAGFNNGTGGVYATLWTTTGLAIYFFPRNAIPADITAGTPNPAKWPLPVGSFPLGNSLCPTSHFQDLMITINLTYCGDWAASMFSQQCPKKGTCNSYVKNNPTAFTQAYWLFKSIKIYNVA